VTCEVSLTHDFNLAFQVLMLVVVRKVMEKFFSKHELQVLDDLMPEMVKKKKLVASMADGIDCIDGDPLDGSESGQVDCLLPVGLIFASCRNDFYFL
jgi:hypothetical protein